MKFPALLILTAASAWCQFTEFATTADGTKVYFTSSLLPRDAPLSTGFAAESRIYFLNGKNPQIVVERGAEARPGFLTSNDGASSLQVSEDGQTVSFVVHNVCPTSEPCLTSTDRAEIRGPQPQVFPNVDQIQLSRNGEWALLTKSASFAEPGQPAVRNAETVLLNRTTGARQLVGTPPLETKFRLASDGSVLELSGGTASNKIGVWKNGELIPIPPISGLVSFQGLSDDAGTLVGTRFLPLQPSFLPTDELVFLDRRSSVVTIIQSPCQPCSHALVGMDNTGTRSLFRTFTPDGPGPMIYADSRNRTAYRLTIPDFDSPVAGTLSGDGRIAIVGTSHARIFRFELNDNGPTQIPDELLPAIPFVDQPLVVAPGALISLKPPVIGQTDWKDKIQFNDRPLVILSQRANSLSAQVPWDLMPGFAKITVDLPSDSPLKQNAQVFVVPQRVELISVPGAARAMLGGYFIKNDFSGSLTEMPKAGEIVHFYATGLGAVVGPIATGQPAPLNELRPLLTRVECQFSSHPNSAETLFAGLAPGLVGIYQITLRLPPDTPSNVLPQGFQCSFGSSNVRAGF